MFVLQLSFCNQNKQKCEDAFPQHDLIEVIDESDGNCNGGAKLIVTIVSDEAFDKVPLIKRHRQVQGILKENMDAIHALSINAWTKVQWEKKKSTPL